MKDIETTSIRLVIDAYERHRPWIYAYVCSCLKQREDAEDLTQDVFLRLLECKQMIRPDTVESFIRTVARHLVIDHVRRRDKYREITAYMFDTAPRAECNTDSRCIAADLSQREHDVLRRLPAQRRRVYALVRFGEKSVAEISEAMGLSRRTVENHLLIGRREVRAYMKRCI